MYCSYYIYYIHILYIHYIYYIYYICTILYTMYTLLILYVFFLHSVVYYVLYLATEGIQLLVISLSAGLLSGRNWRWALGGRPSIRQGREKTHRKERNQILFQGHMLGTSKLYEAMRPSDNCRTLCRLFMLLRLVPHHPCLNTFTSGEYIEVATDTCSQILSGSRARVPHSYLTSPWLVQLLDWSLHRVKIDLSKAESDKQTPPTQTTSDSVLPNHCLGIIAGWLLLSLLLALISLVIDWCVHMMFAPACLSLWQGRVLEASHHMSNAVFYFMYTLLLGFYNEPAWSAEATTLAAEGPRKQIR